MKKVIKHMKVVLIKDVSNVGKIGQIRDVRPGFARNYLMPKNLAVFLGDPKASELIQKQKDRKGKEEIEKVEELEIIEKLSGRKFIFKAKADKKGKLYGSIGSKEIAKKTGLSEKLIKTNYKEIGKYILKINLPDEKKIEIPIEIQKES